MRLAVPLVRAVVTSATGSPAASLKVGDALRSDRRRFTEDDVEAYAATGTRCTWTAPTPAVLAGSRVVHGMLAASLFPALIASRFPGAVYASQSLRFAAPVHVGDEAVVEVKALNIKTSGRRHIVKFSTKCFTNGGVEDDDEEDTRDRWRGHGVPAHAAAQLGGHC